MFRNVMVVLVVLVSVFAVGCASNPDRRNEDTGRVVGGILGGVLGAQVGDGDGRTAAIIAGTLIGAHIGGSIGRNMDENDRMRAAHSLEHNRTGHATEWRNPDTGYRYEMTPTRTYHSDAGPCREYEMQAWIDGRNETVTGTACRQPDGTWRNRG